MTPLPGSSALIHSRKQTDLEVDIDFAISEIMKGPSEPSTRANMELLNLSFPTVSEAALEKGYFLERTSFRTPGTIKKPFGQVIHGLSLKNFLGGEYTNTIGGTDEENFTLIMDFLDSAPRIPAGAAPPMSYPMAPLPQDRGFLSILGGVREHFFGSQILNPVEAFKQWRSSGEPVAKAASDIGVMIAGETGAVARDVGDISLIQLYNLSQNEEMKRILEPLVKGTLVPATSTQPAHWEGGAEGRQWERNKEIADFASTGFGALLMGSPLVRPGVRLGPGLKKILQEAVESQRPKIYKTEVRHIRPTQEMFEAAFETKGHRRALWLANNIPGMRLLLGGIKEAAVADDALKHAGVLAGQMSDVADGAVFAATVRTKLLEYEPSAIGILRDVLRVKDGIATAPGIRQKRPLPGGKMSMAYHDIVENMGHYKLPRNVEKLVREVRSVSKMLTEMLEKEGVPFPKLKGESDFRYVHRLLLQEKTALVDALAPKVEKALRAQGSPIERLATEAKSPWEYLARVTEAVRDGQVRQGEELKKLLTELSDVVDVNIRKQSLTKKRRFTHMIDGLRAGNKYSNSIGDELEAQATIAYQMVIRKRMGELLKKLTLSSDELLEEMGKGGLIVGAKAAKNKAEQGARLLQVLMRGEQRLSATEMKAIAKEFPVQVQELFAIRGIRVPEIRNVIKRLATELRSYLNTTPDKFFQALQVARGLKARRVPVTATEIRKTLRHLGADDRLSAEMLETIYLNSVQIPDKTKAARLIALQNNVKELVAEAKKLSKMTEGELHRERVYHEGQISTGQLGKGLKDLGLEKRFVLGANIGGRKRLGSEVADEIVKEFGHIGPRGAEQAIGIVAEFADYYRLFRASLDMGIQWLHLQGAMGIDAYQSLLYGKPPTLFPQAAGRSYWAAINPQAQWAYWAKPDKYAALVERIQYGSLVQGSEFTSGQTALKVLVRKVPGIGKALEKGVHHTFGRADAAFTTGRNIASNEMWIAFRDMAEMDKSLPELAKMTNLATGVFSLRGIGTSEFKHRFLRAFAFFAPRYTYAQVALFSRLLVPGGYTAAMARKAVGGIIMANTAITTMAAFALGQKPNINPAPKRYGGDGADLWTIRIGNRQYGIGGLGYSMVRVIVETIGAAWDEPETLTPGTFLRFDTENPLVRSFRGKASGPTSLFWTYVTGRDFINEPVRNKDSLYPTKESAKWFIQNALIPIWAEELWDSGGALGPTVAEWFGFRTRVESSWSLYRRTVEEVSGLPFNDPRLDGLELARLAERHPDVREALNLAQTESKGYGWNKKEAAYWQKRDDIKEGYWDVILKGEEQLEDPEAFYSFEKHRNLIQSQGIILRDAYRALSEEFPDVVQRLEEKKLEKVKEGSLSARTIAYYAYFDIIYDPALVGFDGVPFYDERDRQLEELKARVGERTWAEVQEWLGISQKYAPRTLQYYYDMQERIRPWGAIKEAYLMRHPEAALIEELIKKYESPKYANADAIKKLKQLPAYKKMISRTLPNSVSSLRYGLRKKDPELDALLRLWGLVDNSVTDDSERLWELYSHSGIGRAPERIE